MCLYIGDVSKGKIMLPARPSPTQPQAIDPFAPVNSTATGVVPEGKISVGTLKEVALTIGLSILSYG